MIRLAKAGKATLAENGEAYVLKYHVCTCYRVEFYSWPDRAYVEVARLDNKTVELRACPNGISRVRVRP